jgi:hypothetical protein
MAGMSECPTCGSELLQPLRSRACDDGSMVVELRCPECFAWMEAACTRGDVTELDRRQAALRERLVHAYERSVTESMEALGECLGTALALDLIGPDDFAPRVRRGTAPSGARA